jgi:predicted SpoU family rRNA methylase
VQALRVYAIARSRARDKRDVRITAHVENLKRDLGKRGRPKKKRGEEPV